MKVLNFYGLSYHFMPTADVVSNDVSAALTERITTEDNKVIFFDGTIPSAEELYNITNETDLLDTYGSTKVMETPSLTFEYSYDIPRKEKKVKKIPVDALDIEMTGAANGSVWAAILLTDESDPTNPEKSILFTDTIGTWGDETSPIIIDRKTGSVGENNIFKDISLILRDTSSNEQ